MGTLWQMRVCGLEERGRKGSVIRPDAQNPSARTLDPLSGFARIGGLSGRHGLVHNSVHPGVSRGRWEHSVRIESRQQVFSVILGHDRSARYPERIRSHDWITDLLTSLTSDSLNSGSVASTASGRRGWE